MAYLGETIKKLGFGLMRLPKIGDNIDIEQTKVMVDKFMSAGFTYFDTAWAYTGSEDAIRQALVERYPRESFQLATKNAAWVRTKTREEAIAQFDTSLKQSGAGYFDFYLLHNVGENRTKIFDDFDMWNFVQQKKAEGLIKHIGFSCHSTPEDLDNILTAHPETEFVQLQVNYADWDLPSIKAGACFNVARKHGKPVVIMEPVKGGTLANPPESVAKIFSDADANASYASWAIRFAASLEGVITVLSGMSNIEQMEDNIATMEHFISLSEKESKTLDDARIALNRIPLIPCTTCDYCAKVCPNNIAISGSFSAMNFFTLYNNKENARRQAERLLSFQNKKSAFDCIKCGACEDACPQHIKIRDELDRVCEQLLK